MFLVNLRQKMCNKVVFDSVPDQHKTQEMCDNAVDNYVHVLKFVPG